MDNILLSNRYQIIELIGVGGMAKVYRATDTLLQRQVAIKILKEQYAEDEEFLKKFSNEAQSAAKLSHINIVSVYDIGQDTIDGKIYYYIVMEYVEGQTLKDLIEDEKILSNHDLTDFSIQIAQALKSAHSYSIVHRDIKPQNILIDNYGLLKVTDFGIARVSTNATITYTSSVLGTVHYISPEQAKGKFVDKKSDLYSLGVVMYEMATGKVPFDADNSVGIAIMHIQDSPVRPKELNPDLTDHLDKIIMKLLNKDPMERFTNARELINALEDENYAFDEDEVIQETTRIPLITDDDQIQVLNTLKDEEIEDSDEEKPEAIYVSSSENKPKEKKKKRRFAILPIATILILLAILAGYFISRDRGDTVEVPSVLNLTEEEAVKELESRGLKANVSRYAESDNYEEGTVMQQDPESKTNVKEGTTINLVISQGREAVVPDLSGLTVERAEEKLKELGLSLGRTNAQNSDQVEKDLIISQSPNSGQSLQVGSEVDITVSLGVKEPEVTMVTVPNVVGQTEANARSIIGDNGLSLRDVSYQYSDTVAEGLVISQSISANTKVASESQMDIVVSQGVDPAKNEDENNNDDNNQANDSDNSNQSSVNVQFKIQAPTGKDSFNVKVYKVEDDGSTSDLLYNQNLTSSQVDNSGNITLNFKSVVGTRVKILYDNESVGEYVVEK